MILARASLRISLLGTLCLGTAVPGQELPGNLPAAAAPASSARMLGLGGRLTWMQRPLDDPRLWLDGQILLQPLPRLFVQGGWGRASSRVQGSGSDTSVAETRWDLTLGVVLLQGAASGYLPLRWRKISQRHSWKGDADWTEIGTGIGALVPVRDWFSLQTEATWMAPLHAHDDVALGTGRKSDDSHLGLSVGFVVFVK